MTLALLVVYIKYNLCQMHIQLVLTTVNFENSSAAAEIKAVAFIQEFTVMSVSFC